MRWMDLEEGDVLDMAWPPTGWHEDAGLRLVLSSEPHFEGSAVLELRLLNLSTSATTTHARLGADEVTPSYSVLRGAALAQEAG